MKIDISELLEETKRKYSIIRNPEIKGQKLIINYAYSNAENIFDTYYDSAKKDFHIIVHGGIFPFSSVPQYKEFDLPPETRRIRVDLTGNKLEKMSSEEVIKHFFPKLKSEEERNDI